MSTPCGAEKAVSSLDTARGLLSCDLRTAAVAPWSTAERNCTSEVFTCQPVTSEQAWDWAPVASVPDVWLVAQSGPA